MSRRPGEEDEEAKMPQLNLPEEAGEKFKWRGWSWGTEDETAKKVPADWSPKGKIDLISSCWSLD